MEREVPAAVVHSGRLRRNEATAEKGQNELCRGCGRAMGR